jgi:hypothetical protein
MAWDDYRIVSLQQRFRNKSSYLSLGLGILACSGRAISGNEPTAVGGSSSAAGGGGGTPSPIDSSGAAGTGATTIASGGSTSPSKAEGPCNTPYELGSTDFSDPHTQLLWTGIEFLIAWRDAEGYTLRGISTLGGMSGTTLPNPVPGKPFTASLLWVNNRPEVYWTQDTVITRNVYETRLGEIRQTEQISDGVWPSGFTHVGGEVLFTTFNALYVEGVQHDVYWGGPQVLGYNGTDLLGAEVLGHGEWQTSAAAGAPNWAKIDPPIDKQWAGASYVHGGGASFASSPETGRHAMSITSGRDLWVAVQGYEPWQGQAQGQLPEASFVWDGERYALFLADGPATFDGEGDGMAQRDLILHFVSPEGQVDSFDRGIPISLSEEDDSAPAAVAAGAGRYGIVWKRGRSIVFTECQIDIE